jgi:flagellar motor switch protein FliM
MITEGGNKERKGRSLTFTDQSTNQSITQSINQSNSESYSQSSGIDAHDERKINDEWFSKGRKGRQSESILTGFLLPIQGRNSSARRL